MGKLSGTVLILAGVAVAAYTLSSQRDAGTEIAAAQETAQETMGAMPPAVSDPGIPTVEVAPPATSTAPPTLATPPQPEPVQPMPEAGVPAATPAGPPVAAHRLRSGAPPALRLAETPPRTPVGTTPVGTKSAGRPPLSGLALTSAIQRELKRIGCYQGNVSGVWSPSVRQAMKAFTDRVNASLPVDQPDPVLLAMAQGQAPGTCSDACPSGQERAADGRCLPSALVANAGKLRTAAPSASARAKAGPARVHPAPARGKPALADPADGRMALAGPPVSAQRQVPIGPRTTATTRHGKAATSSRSANLRSRQRQRAAQRPYYGFSGFSGWPFPFLP